MGTEREPDYRESLAAERTYLAYVRTALALTAAGVAAAGALPLLGEQTLRKLVGGLLVVAGALVAMLGRRRWQAVDRAMRRGEPLPVTATAHLTWVLVAVCILALIIVVAT